MTMRIGSMLPYRLKHKDHDVALMEFEDSFCKPYVREVLDKRHLPLALEGNEENISAWWKQRLHNERIPCIHDDEYVDGF